MLHKEFESFHDAYTDLSNLMAEIESLNLIQPEEEEVKEEVVQPVYEEVEQNELNTVDLNENALPAATKDVENDNAFEVDKTQQDYESLILKHSGKLMDTVKHFYDDADMSFYSEYFEIINRACAHYCYWSSVAGDLLRYRIKSSKEHHNAISTLLIENGADVNSTLRVQSITASNFVSNVLIENGKVNATLSVQSDTAKSPTIRAYSVSTLLNAVESNHNDPIITLLIDHGATDSADHNVLKHLLSQQNDKLAAKLIKQSIDRFEEIHHLFPEFKDDEENIELVYFNITNSDGNIIATDRPLAHLTLLRAMAILEKEDKKVFNYTTQDKKIYLNDIQAQIQYIQSTQNDPSLRLRELVQLYEKHIHSPCLNYIRHTSDWLINKAGISTYTTSRIEFLMTLQDAVMTALIEAWENNHDDICKLINLVQHLDMFAKANIKYSLIKNVDSICALMRGGSQMLRIEKADSVIDEKSLSDEAFANHKLNGKNEPKLLEKFPEEKSEPPKADANNTKTNNGGILSSLSSIFYRSTATTPAPKRPTSTEQVVEMKDMSKTNKTDYNKLSLT